MCFKESLYGLRALFRQFFIGGRIAGAVGKAAHHQLFAVFTGIDHIGHNGLRTFGNIVFTGGKEECGHAVFIHHAGIVGCNRGGRRGF